MFRRQNPLRMLRAAASSRTCVGLGTAASLLVLAQRDRQARQQENESLVSEEKTSYLNSFSRLSALQSSIKLPFLSFSDTPCRCYSAQNRRGTLRRIEKSSSKDSLNSRYLVHWDAPLGEGAYGTVYAATDRETGDKVALKKISKSFTDDLGFQREMEAFLHLRDAGGHPNICVMHENFNEGGHYYLCLDLVSGGEMFDHLIRSGPYSEADAARLVREVASAVAFLHGIGCVHGDLKPENLMLSTENVSDAVVKVIDFGCAQVTTDNGTSIPTSIGNTIAYCPPEVLLQSKATKMEPSLDMWSLGIIVYIMLIGCHPFDFSGQSTDREITQRVISLQPPELVGSPLAAHLSSSAVDVMQRLIEPDPSKRITAEELLQHPWVRGETARQDKMTDSDKKLSKFRPFKSQLEVQIFEQMFQWANEKLHDDVSKRSSLIERSFRNFDAEQKGFITAKDLGVSTEDDSESEESLSLSAFSDLLGEHLKNKYFRKDQVVYREGEEGNEMFFINSGVVEISTKNGFRILSKQGDFVGEGALLSPDKIRSATVKCVTPVHAIEVTREYFDKYLASSESTLSLKMREQDKNRAINRTKTILRQQNELKPLLLSKGDFLYEIGDEGDELYILEKGKVNVLVDDHTVFTLKPGDMCGEHSLIVGRPHGTSATCVSKRCRFQVMQGHDFHSVLQKSSSLKESVNDVSLRREFKKAVVFRTKKPFPATPSELREVFDAVDLDGNGTISLDEIRTMIKQMDPAVPEEEIAGIMKSLDIDESGAVDFEEFSHIFGLDVTKSSNEKSSKTKRRQRKD